MKNNFDLSVIQGIIIIAVVLVVVFALVYATTSTDSRKIEKEILEYLKNDTEDSGEYIILLQKASDYYAPDYPNAKFYYAWMTDSDGDTVMKAVRYVSSDDIEAITVFW